MKPTDDLLGALKDSMLVPCKVCDGNGRVTIPASGDTMAYRIIADCPCTRRSPCDLMCRCSGGPL